MIPTIKDLDAIRFEIARIVPEFEGEPIVPLGEGMDSLAVLAGGAFVFRFTKHAEADQGLKREVALLPRLGPRLKLDIPRFEYLGAHSVTGLPFDGYRLIRGEPLHQPLYDGLAAPTRDGLLGDLAAFLAVVHAFPVDEATECGIGAEGGRAGYIEDLGRAREDVFPRLDKPARYAVDPKVASFLEDDRNFACTPTLLHGDLWPEHVLFSTAVGRLTGVIDIGDVSIGDRDYDLAFLA